MVKLFMALGLVLFSTTSVLAVDLENRDSQAYQVLISESGSTREISIEPGQALLGVCSDTGCQIEVNGIGSINATTPLDKFAIEEGALVVDTVTSI